MSRAGLRPLWRGLTAGLVLVFSGAACERAGEEPAAESAQTGATIAASETYADPASCAGCHSEAAAAWRESHHDRAMEPATPETVLGDFEGTEFTHHGVTSRFRRDGDGFRVETEGEDGALADFEIAYTFGVEPLQQYLVRFPRGRLQSLTVAWDTERRRWFSLYPDEPIPPDDPLHWTGPAQRWNIMCADCHSTALERGYDVSSDRYATEKVALDVSCQACHGPGGAHARWAEALARGEQGLGSDRGLGADPTSRSSREQVEACAPCHSRRHRVSGRAVPGEPFLDHYVPALLLPGLYHADGQIQDEVYVYGSFLQSRMYAHGVRCSDCHEPHGLGLRAEGNALCERCHGLEPDGRFAGLVKKDYDTRDHHLHEPGSPGAACVTCHMPARTYMQVDPRRDHSLRVPRPDLSPETGAPNVCVGCHAERDAGWAAAALAEHRGTAELPGHFGEALAAGRGRQQGASARLRTLAGDGAQPAIARATALEMLGDSLSEPGSVDAIVAGSRDAEPLVRLSAARMLAGVEPRRAVPELARLVGDRLRAVRIEAARTLSGIPDAPLSSEQRQRYALVLDEYRAGQQALADTPEAHLNLGVLAARRGRPGAAEKSYRTALGLRPDFVPARVNLANLLNAQGRNDEAEAELRSALEVVAGPTYRDDAARRETRGELEYSLGLLLAETGRLDEAIASLREARVRLGNRPRVHYNLGLALQHRGRRAEAEVALARAFELAPDEPSHAYALAVLYAQEGRHDEALRAARGLEAAAGNDPEVRAFVEQLEQSAARR